MKSKLNFACAIALLLVSLAACAPATPKNRALMRFSLHSGLRREELDHVLRVCEEIRDDTGMWNWKSTKRRKV